MDSFEINKLIGALLGVVFVVFSISLIGDAIFAAPIPEKPGFAIEAAEPEEGAAGGGEAAAAVPIATTRRDRTFSRSSTDPSPRMRASPIRPP